MSKEYICIGYGIDKNTGAPYSSVAPIFEGTTKDGRPFGMIQDDQRMSVNDTLKIGERKRFSLVAEK